MIMPSLIRALVRRPRAAASAATAALACAALAGCGSSASGDASASHPVSLGVTVSNATEPYVIPWLVGQDQGFFEDHGVTINKIIPSKGGSTTLRNMLSGSVPIADSGLSSVIESTAAKAPVTVIGGATQSAYGLDYYTLANSKVHDLKDVRTWAYTSPGSVTQSLTYMIPKVAGVTTKVKRVAAGGVGEGLALLESGDVDVAVIPPSISAKNPDKYRLVVPSAQYLSKFQQTVITTTPEYAKSHPKVLRAVTAGYQQAVDWIAKHPAQAGALYAKYSDIDPAVATDVVKKAVSFNNWGVGFNAEAVANAIDAAKATGFKGDVDVCSVFDPSFLPDGASTKLPSC
jgi:NitT/TauT family transport system substrate-binding protein